MSVAQSIASPVAKTISNVQSVGFLSWTSELEVSARASDYFDAITNAGGTISAGNQDKVTALFSSLYDNGVLDKIIALYLYHGNNLASAAINAVNPGSHAGAHAITWTGTPILDANGGITPSSGNYGASIHPDGAGMIDLFGAGLGYYGTSNAATSEYTMGVYDSLYLAPKVGGAYCRLSGGLANTTSQNLSGFHFATREANSSTIQMYRNGTSYYSTTVAFSNNYCNTNTARARVGGMFEAPSTSYASTTPIKLSIFTEGLSASEVALLNTAIQTYVA